jgi:hypothetical protein
MQVRKERKKERYCKVFEMLIVVCSADVNIPKPYKCL